MNTLENITQTIKQFYLIPIPTMQTLIEADPPINFVNDYLIPNNPDLENNPELLRVAYSAIAMRVYGYGLIKAPADRQDLIQEFYENFNNIADELSSLVGEQVVTRPHLDNPQGFKQLRLLIN